MRDPTSSGDSANRTSTSWLHVLVVIAAGFAVAAQVGKVPAALPVFTQRLSLGLSEASVIVSIFSVLAAATGVMVGRIAERVGNLRAALSGLVVCAAGSLAGAEVSSYELLLASRLVEGLGFIIAVVSLPPLAVSRCTPGARPLVLGMWGAFMPGGMSLMLLASPAVMAGYGWQGLWRLAGVCLLLAAAAVFVCFRRDAPLRAAADTARLRHIIGRRGPLLLALCFGAYSAQFIAVTAFVPTLLLDSYGLTLSLAATLGALVVAANVAGNITAGWLLRAGASRRRLLITGALVMGIATTCFFNEALPLAVRYGAAVVFAAVGGLLPGALFAAAPAFAANTAQLAVLSGLLLQGSGIGQLAGPVLLALTVENLGGWAYAPLFTASAAALGLLAAMLLPAEPVPSHVR